MKATDFLRQTERTFGEYAPGMKEGVAAFVQTLAERALDQLYLKLLNEHEEHWPPALAKIRRLLREIGNQPPSVALLGAPPMCKEERAAGMRELLKSLVEKKRMPKEKIGK